MTMRRSLILGQLAAFVLTLAAAHPAVAAGCTVIVNGIALDPGQARVSDGHLLLSSEGLSRGLGLTVTEGEEGGPWTVRGFGRSMLVRPDATQYMLGDELRSAPVCPRADDGGLWVPLAMLREAFAIDVAERVDEAGVEWALSTPGAEITDVREGLHRESVRIVLDLERPTVFTWRNEAGRLVLELPAPRDEGAWSRRVRLLSIDDPLVDDLREGPTAGGTIRVQIAHSSPLPPRVFSLAEPPRIVIDLFRDPGDVAPEPQPEPVTPLPRAAGILDERNFCTPRGPVRVFVLEVEPSSPHVSVRPALAAPTVHRRATVTRMVACAGAWGGVNGGFFSRQGPPLGMLVIDGEWIREPWGGRTVLGITEDGELLMERLRFASRAVFDGIGTQKLHALNRGHDEMDTLIAYTSRWGRSLTGARHCTRLVVSAAGEVTQKETDGRVLSVPEGGFILSGNGRMARSLDTVPVGTAVALQLGTDPRWPSMRHAIGGGPRLVKDGRPHLTAAPERFRPDVYASAPSRTAVGFTREGRLLLVVAEGTGERSSGGMTLEEMAATMIKLGAWQAMNLDGGGSSSFVADGRLLNRPADGAARRVSNALLVFTEQAERAAGR